MDLQNINQTNDPVNQDLHAPSSSGNTLRGGTIIPEHISSNEPILDRLTDAQRHASVINADLRKKLRVDRVKKMTMGTAALNTAIEDPLQPDWMK